MLKTRLNGLISYLKMDFKFSSRKFLCSNQVVYATLKVKFQHVLLVIAGHFAHHSPIIGVFKFLFLLAKKTFLNCLLLHFAVVKVPEMDSQVLVSIS